MNEMERRKLLQFISEVSFALLDCNLYLDTHPCDEEALAYYEKYKKLRKESLEEYQENFGPLLNDGVDCNEHWTWVNTPWPWEGEC